MTDAEEIWRSSTRAETVGPPGQKQEASQITTSVSCERLLHGLPLSGCSLLSVGGTV